MVDQGAPEGALRSQPPKPASRLHRLAEIVTHLGKKAEKHLNKGTSEATYQALVDGFITLERAKGRKDDSGDKRFREFVHLEYGDKIAAIQGKIGEVTGSILVPDKVDGGYTLNGGNVNRIMGVMKHFINDGSTQITGETLEEKLAAIERNGLFVEISTILDTPADKDERVQPLAIVLDQIFDGQGAQEYGLVDARELVMHGASDMLTPQALHAVEMFGKAHRIAQTLAASQNA